MPEYACRPVRGPLILSRRVVLTALAALAPLAAARPDAAAPATQDQFRTLLGVPGPAEQLAAAPPALQLARLPESLSLLVVSAQPAAQVAARYGVSAAAVDPLPRPPGEAARVLRVQLPPAGRRHRPVLPRSVRRYTVAPGETLARVAARHDLSVLELLSANLALDSLDRLTPGQTLLVPTAERGLLVRIKPGQTALSLVAGYGADLGRTARANGRLPTALTVGDYLLLPGVQAGSLYRRLTERRAARQAAARRGRLQQQYDAYLAWQRSPERQQLIERYKRQAQYEAAQAARQAQAQRQEAAQALSLHPAGIRVSAGSQLAWPVPQFRITSRFGEADIDFHKQVFHGGVDLAAPAGTPVYAAAPGRVAESGVGAYGLNVYTTQGSSTLIYGHLSRTAVQAGQDVQTGDLLGEVGCTGVCTGPHLHFEIRLEGRAVDPLALLP